MASSAGGSRNNLSQSRWGALNCSCRYKLAMTDSQLLSHETDPDEDRADQIMEQLDVANFTIEEYRQLAETLLMSIGIAYQESIDDDSPVDEIEFLSSTATRFFMACELISMENSIEEGSEDDDGIEDDED
jgi:hypothetical protein